MSIKKNKSLEQKILDGEEIELTEEQKENAIKKEEYYRNLYSEIYEFKQTKDFKELCNMLVKGYHCMMYAYKDKPEIKGDIDFIIKFAFRDFFLLLFIGIKDEFDKSEFLKKIHKEVYFSQTYVTLEQFEKLIKYCTKVIGNDESK